MYYVYLIASVNVPKTYYVGYTTNLKNRLGAHNSGESPYTAKYKPWELVLYLSFINEATAKEFERYLKSQSGRAFIKKRFV